MISTAAGFRRDQLTSVHSSKHARDELVDTKRFLDERDKRRDTTFVGVGATKVGKDELLERFDLVLKGHEVGDGFVADRQTEGGRAEGSFNC